MIVTDPLAAIKDGIDAQQGQFDILIVMSHVGVFFDEKLCQEIPEIDVILGAIRTIILKMEKSTMAF